VTSFWRTVCQSFLFETITNSWTVRGTNPDGGEIFRTRPDRPWGLPSLLYSGYLVFPGCKAAGRGFDHPPPSSTKVKERVQLYLSSLPRPSWPVLGWTLPFIISSLQQFVLMLVRKSKREVVVMVIWTKVYYYVLRNFLDNKFLLSLRGFFEDRFYCP